MARPSMSMRPMPIAARPRIWWSPNCSPSMSTPRKDRARRDEESDKNKVGRARSLQDCEIENIGKGRAQKGQTKDSKNDGSVGERKPRGRVDGQNRYQKNER